MNPLDCEECKNGLICQLDDVYSLIKNYRLKDMTTEGIKDKVLFIYVEDTMNSNNLDRMHQELKKYGCLGVVVLHESFMGTKIDTMNYSDLVNFRDHINTIIAKKHLTKL